MENLEDISAEGWREPKWYVCFVRSNQEKKIAGSLAARTVEHYLPCYTSVRQWKDRRVRLEVPLFPGYVFVHLPLAERMKVLTVPNVVSLVGPGRFPSEVREEELRWIKCGVEQGTAQPHSFLNQGDRVMITSGIMSGMEGVLIRHHKGVKVVVAIESIFRAFVVELDEDCVQPLHAKLPMRSFRGGEPLSEAKHLPMTLC